MSEYQELKTKIEKVEDDFNQFLLNDWKHHVKTVHGLSIRVWIIVGSITIITGLLFAILECLLRSKIG